MFAVISRGVGRLLAVARTLWRGSIAARVGILLCLVLLVIASEGRGLHGLAVGALILGALLIIYSHTLRR